jgi:type IV pilus assembly protein PilA
MKKGFTLIELLAVIIILSVIALIAVPEIMYTIETAKIGANKETENVVTKAAEKYLVMNRESLPSEIGETYEVSLNELVDAKYVSEVSDCSGYVLVTKTNQGYSYEPILKYSLDNEVQSSEDDGLVLNYSFNQYSEGTNNLISDTNKVIADYFVIDNKEINNITDTENNNCKK